MAKQRKALGYYVRVEPDNWLHRTDPEQDRVMCNVIADEIRRHVDDTRSVTVDCDTADVCEFCGEEWTEDSITSNGGCCDEDMEHEP